MMMDLAKISLDITPNTQATKEEQIKWITSNQKFFNRVKGNLCNRENICKLYI